MKGQCKMSAFMKVGNGRITLEKYRSHGNDYVEIAASGKLNHGTDNVYDSISCISMTHRQAFMLFRELGHILDIGVESL
jgi:hypothetical protein